MRALSALFAVLLVSVGVAPVMACNPLEPGNCTGYSFTESSGAVDDSNIVVNSDELTGDTKNAAIAQALSDTAVQRLRDGLLRDGFILRGRAGRSGKTPPFRVGMKAEPPFVTQLPETIYYCKDKQSLYASSLQVSDVSQPGVGCITHATYPCLSVCV